MFGEIVTTVTFESNVADVASLESCRIKVENSPNSVLSEYVTQYEEQPTESTRKRNGFTAQVYRGLTVGLSSSDGRHVPGRWAKKLTLTQRRKTTKSGG